MSRCIGWHCLNIAQKFGIGLSIAVVVIVLLVAWMYYLGRRAQSWKNRNLITLPGGRRMRKNPNLPPTISLGELPIAQRWPGQPPQIVYQPVIYNIDPPNATRAQPYLIAGPCQPIRPPPLACVPRSRQVNRPQDLRQEIWPQRMPAPPQQLPHYRHSQRRPSLSESSSNADEEPMKSSWSQKLNRAFGLPLGRASTIDSTVSRESDNREASPVRGGNMAGDSRVAAEGNTNSPDQPMKSSKKPIDAQSIRTQSSNAATVHSDDYDMVRSSSKRNRTQNQPESRASSEECKLDVDFYRSLSTPSEQHQNYHETRRHFRTPSPRPPVVVDLSPASDSLSDASHFSPSPISGTGLPRSQSTEFVQKRLGQQAS